MNADLLLGFRSLQNLTSASISTWPSWDSRLWPESNAAPGSWITLHVFVTLRLCSHSFKYLFSLCCLLNQNPPLTAQFTGLLCDTFPSSSSVMEASLLRVVKEKEHAIAVVTLAHWCSVTIMWNVSTYGCGCGTTSSSLLYTHSTQDLTQWCP